jgi:hypothetical protein
MAAYRLSPGARNTPLQPAVVNRGPWYYWQRVPSIQVCRHPRGGPDHHSGPKQQYVLLLRGLDVLAIRLGRRTLYAVLHITVYPCGNFSGTSSLKFRGTKGSIGHTFMVCIHTENQNQGDFCPFALLEISVLHESPLGHLRYGLTDVPPQPNSPPDNVINPDRPARDLNARKWSVKTSSASLIK